MRGSGRTEIPAHCNRKTSLSSGGSLPSSHAWLRLWNGKTACWRDAERGLLLDDRLVQVTLRREVATVGRGAILDGGGAVHWDDCVHAENPHFKMHNENEKKVKENGGNE